MNASYSFHKTGTLRLKRKLLSVWVCSCTFFICEEHFELQMLTVRHFSEEMNIFLVASLNWKQTTSSILAFFESDFCWHHRCKGNGMVLF